MTLRNQMIASIRRAVVNHPDRAEKIRRFLLDQQNPDGGFRGNGSSSDIYYTLFAVESLWALEELSFVDACVTFLRSHPNEFNDLIHFAALIRCYASLLPEECRQKREWITKHFQSFYKDGCGYCLHKTDSLYTIYSCFLAVDLAQTLNNVIEQKDQVIGQIRKLRLDNGCFVNHSGIPIGSVPATAAAIVALYYLDKSVDEQAADWLLSQFEITGGCKAAPLCDSSDLLSTAVSLHALATIGYDYTRVSDTSYEYVLSLWDESGGFLSGQRGNALDCEYTYYGLLALGHL